MIGWKKMDNQGGFVNETTGQTLIVTKKQFGQHYVVLLFPRVKGTEEGRKLSPEFPTETKADAYAMDLMAKNPNGFA